MSNASGRDNSRELRFSESDKELPVSDWDSQFQSMEPGSAAPFGLRVFGGVDLRDAAGRPVESVLRQPKRLAVLAYLACARPRGFHRRDKVAALFWPELSSDRARAALRTTLSRLRDDLGDGCLVSRAADEIGIDFARLRCDAVLLDECLQSDDPSAARELYGGLFLEGVHVDGAGEGLESWIAAERTRIPQQLASALHRHAQRAAEQRNLGSAVSLLRQALEVSPLDERIGRDLISAQLDSGNRGAALATFESLRAGLRREFSVAPSAATMALIAPIRQEQDVVATRRQPVDAGRRDHVSEATSSSISASAALGGSLPTGRRRRVELLTVLLLSVSAAVWGGAQLAAEAASRRHVQWRLAPSGDGRREARHHPTVLLDSTRTSLAVVGGLVRAQPLLLADDILRARGVTANRKSEWRTDVASGRDAPSRWIAASALDLEHDRAFVFGGASGSTLPCHNDLWLLSDISGLGGSTTWSRVRTRGTLPSARADAQLFFDRSRRELLLYGGHDCVSTYHHDAWTLRFDDATLKSGEWIARRVAPGADEPTPRVHSMVEYDARDGRLVVIHGQTAQGPQDESWVLEGLHGDAPVTWRMLRCENAPLARAHAASVWDDAAQEMVIIGGRVTQTDATNEVWRLSGLAGTAAACTWEQLDPAGPVPAERYAAVAHFDPRARRVIVFGGYHQGAPLIDIWTMSDPFRP